MVKFHFRTVQSHLFISEFMHSRTGNPKARNSNQFFFLKIRLGTRVYILRPFILELSRVFGEEKIILGNYFSLHFRHL